MADENIKIENFLPPFVCEMTDAPLHGNAHDSDDYVN